MASERLQGAVVLSRLARRRQSLRVAGIPQSGRRSAPLASFLLLSSSSPSSSSSGRSPPSAARGGLGRRRRRGGGGGGTAPARRRQIQLEASRRGGRRAGEAGGPERAVPNNVLGHLYCTERRPPEGRSEQAQAAGAGRGGPPGAGQVQTLSRGHLGGDCRRGRRRGAAAGRARRVKGQLEGAGTRRGRHSSREQHVHAGRGGSSAHRDWDITGHTRDRARSGAGGCGGLLRPL